MSRKVKNINEFRSLLLASLSSQELSIVGSCVKSVCGSQQVGKSASFESTPYGKAKKSEPRKCQKWSNVSFRRGRSTSQHKSPSVYLLLARITRLDYGAFHNFKKLEPFMNASLGWCFRKYV